MIDSCLSHNLENFTEKANTQCVSILAAADAGWANKNYTDMEDWKEKWEINQLIC